jgi:hypothetical protein
VSGSEAKLRALIRASICVDAQEARDAQAVWIWAMAESIGSEVVHAVVQDRRAAFQSMILGGLRASQKVRCCRTGCDGDEDGLTSCKFLNPRL